jgi:hypothetical protein
MSKYMIIRDTREKEKKGWQWRKSLYCEGTVDETMKTGDYTLQGYEGVLTIERKGRISEFAKNVNEVRFVKELERMTQFKHAYVILEFTMRDLLNYPIGSGIPRYKWKYLKFKGPFILKKLTEMMRDYPNIHFVLAGDAGKETASSIFKRIVESERVNPDSAGGES